MMKAARSLVVALILTAGCAHFYFPGQEALRAGDKTVVLDIQGGAGFDIYVYSDSSHSLVSKPLPRELRLKAGTKYSLDVRKANGWPAFLLLVESVSGASSEGDRASYLLMSESDFSQILTMASRGQFFKVKLKSVDKSTKLTAQEMPTGSRFK